ncbi:thiamine biosynthesis protein ThiS [Alteribacter lacisalsi]|uniref:Thiamine biosynthesis protein ThiS n=1 Tax=Alteribacter lacisalsi TaxID=2045244 RepID=A0A2W0HAX1_9BACI|nr:sulfur carrier protein ThiS [Alteribacter lacisalsi]PYZ99013.1 thiamine biosynthesis protein ThiS [Alteribacter lacisalsi]
MKIVVNGEEHLIDARNVSDVVAHFNLEPKLVVAEIDGRILDRADWERTSIEENARLELVQFIGGG